MSKLITATLGMFPGLCWMVAVLPGGRKISPKPRILCLEALSKYPACSKDN